ncbi:MAG: 4-hydroxy-tetrahydrodipicolinate synthase [Christensenellaceae bacterium]|nr:4-hydroxy-tetrahydrodipicolinate synthase [Christensenellaceae bacterium]
MKIKLFEGVATALITPFKTNEEIDFTALKKLFLRQIEQKADAVVILGTTGEPPTLTLAEKHKIIKLSVKLSQTATYKFALILGIGGNNPKESIKLAKFFENEIKKQPKNKLLSHGVLLTAPYYNKTTQAGLIEYFKFVAENINLPIIVYNVPSRTGMNIEPKTFEKLARIKNIVGVKEASGNISQIADVVRFCPNLAVYSGDDTICLASFAVGCRGIISVASNVSVELLREIYENASANPKIARDKFLTALPFFKSLFVCVNPIPIKYELSKIGLCKNILRLPLVPIK